MALSEVDANTLRHTKSGGVVRAWHTCDEIVCQIEDGGLIDEPLAGRSARSSASRGHGLWLVNQVCDLVQIRSGPAGAVVWMRMRLRL